MWNGVVRCESGSLLVSEGGWVALALIVQRSSRIVVETIAGVMRRNEDVMRRIADGMRRSVDATTMSVDVMTTIAVVTMTIEDAITTGSAIARTVIATTTATATTVEEDNSYDVCVVCGQYSEDKKNTPMPGLEPGSAR